MRGHRGKPCVRGGRTWRRRRGMRSQKGPETIYLWRRFYGGGFWGVVVIVLLYSLLKMLPAINILIYIMYYYIEISEI